MLQIAVTSSITACVLQFNMQKVKKKVNRVLLQILCLKISEYCSKQRTTEVYVLYGTSCTTAPEGLDVTSLLNDPFRNLWWCTKASSAGLKTKETKVKSSIKGGLAFCAHLAAIFGYTTIENNCKVPTFSFLFFTSKTNRLW